MKGKQREPIDAERYEWVVTRFRRLAAEGKLQDYVHEEYASKRQLELIEQALMQLPLKTTNNAIKHFNEWQELYVTAKGWAKIKALMRQRKYVESNDVIPLRHSREAYDAISNYAKANKCTIDEAIIRLTQQD